MTVAVPYFGHYFGRELQFKGPSIKDARARGGRGFSQKRTLAEAEGRWVRG